MRVTRSSKGEMNCPEPLAEFIPLRGVRVQGMHHNLAGLLCIRAKRVVHGGGERIRTSDTFSGMRLFESRAFNHSATPPKNYSTTHRRRRGPAKGGDQPPFLEWVL